jgi:hypothetical protein
MSEGSMNIGKLRGYRQKKAVKPLIDWLKAAHAVQLQRQTQNKRMLDMVMHREPWAGPTHDLMVQNLGKREYKQAQHWVFSSYMIAHEWTSLAQAGFKEPELDLKIATFKWYAHSFKKLTLVDPEAPEMVLKFKKRPVYEAVPIGLRSIVQDMTGKRLQAHDRFLAISFLNHLLDLDQRLNTNAFERTLEFFKYLNTTSSCMLFLDKLWKDPFKHEIDYDDYHRGIIYEKNGTRSENYSDKKIKDSINIYLRLMDYPEISLVKPFRLYGPTARLLSF